MENDYKTMGVREFARFIKRSPSWVVNMAHRGIIRKNDDGKILVNESLKAVSEYCDVMESKQKQSSPDENIGGLLSFDEARAKKENYLAEIKELEAKVMRGEFVAVDEVKADARETAERLRAFCLSAPSRYSGLLENKSQREVEKVLDSMFDELLEKIHGGKFTGVSM